MILRTIRIILQNITKRTVLFFVNGYRSLIQQREPLPPTRPAASQPFFLSTTSLIPIGYSTNEACCTVCPSNLKG